MVEVSKELLSEVMSIKIEDIIDLKMFGKDLKYYEKCLLKSCCDGRLSKHKDSICKSINIYELANKCKEWANKKSYTVIDYIDINNDEFWTCRAYPNGLNDGFDYEAIYQPLSPISIFDVCQWILDNKN